MRLKMSIFQKSVVNKYLSDLNQGHVDTAYNIFLKKFTTSRIIKINQLKEEEYQDGFFRDLFVDIFGYTLKPDDDYNLVREFKNQTDSKKADGAILKNRAAIAVIELKSTHTKNLNSVTDQAFNYKNNQSECRYVITSNFRKLRLYIDYATEYEEFDLFHLSKDDFKKLYLLLSKDYLFRDVPIKLKEETIVHEENVSKQLYQDYSDSKNRLFNNLVEKNSGYDKLTLFKKSQKLIDRFLFILFSEDRGLLPPNSIDRIIKRFNILKEEDSYKPLYDIYKQYFGYMNIGRKGKRVCDDISAYNGGLFYPDKVLDSMEIDDRLLTEDLQKLSAYDFNTEVDVNILGHIFEHSLSEIEEINAKLKGIETDKAKSKRKKDGIFYTPDYITKYIVESTVGQLCEGKRKEFRLYEILIDDSYHTKRGKLSKKGKVLFQKIEEYQKWLLSIKILDPACGSGAFLNQALNFLIDEHNSILELQAELDKGQIPLFNIETAVLEKNLYGVDINEESIEIAKLSLWLRTAHKGRKLSILSNNIKCGNTLIDNSEIAGEKAFNWEKEFPGVFKQGGFDVVIGNPPYGILIDKQLQGFYNEKFPFTSYKINLYILFIERMMQVFNKGIIHFIIPKSLLFNSYYETIRKYLIKKTEINEILTITEKVFEDAEVGSSLLLKFTLKQNPNVDNFVTLIEAEKIENFKTKIGIIENQLPQSYFLNVPNCEISIVSSKLQGVLDKLDSFKPISNYYLLKNGLNPGNIKEILISDRKESERHKPIIWGKEISKYNIKWGGDYVHYDETIRDRISIDDIKSKDGMNKQNRIDFALRSPELFEKKKLVVRKTGDSLICCVDEDNYYFDTLVHGIYRLNDKFDEEYLLAILNSNPATLFYRLLHDIKGKVFAKISLTNLGSFPIPEGELSERRELSGKAKSRNEITQVLIKESMVFKKLLIIDLGLKKITNKLNYWFDMNWGPFEAELKKQKIVLALSSKSEWIEHFEVNKEKIQELKFRISTLDEEIDQFVYKLYGIVEEEIATLNSEK
jgi:hypothetical protein